MGFYGTRPLPVVPPPSGPTRFWRFGHNLAQRNGEEKLMNADKGKVPKVVGLSHKDAVAELKKNKFLNHDDILWGGTDEEKVKKQKPKKDTVWKFKDVVKLTFEPILIPPAKRK
jgi:hypothetical protein